MTKFIDVSGETKEENKKTVFTHILTEIGGWEKTKVETSFMDKIKYLGKCESDGDMFACYSGGRIHIYKGTKGSEFD